MKSSELFKQLISDVVCTYGAPIGRMSCGTKPDNERVYKRNVPINSGGYDSGGAYWGIGKPLYVEYNKDLTYIRFYRSE